MKKDEDKYERDLKRFQAFVKAWNDSSLEASNVVYRKVQAICTNVAKKYHVDSDELVISALLVLAKSKFQGKSSLDNYIRTIALSECLKEFRKAVKHSAPMEESAFITENAFVTNAEEVLIREEFEFFLKRFLLTRPALQRIIFEFITNVERQKRPSNRQIVSAIQGQLPNVSPYQVNKELNRLKEDVFNFLIIPQAHLKVLKDNTTEADLIAKIANVITKERRQEYDKLYNKFKSGDINKTEKEKLLRVSNEFEILNARRLKYLSELAKLRRQPLTKVMSDLGIKAT